MLAEENPARATIATATPAAQPIQFVLLKLREQLCIGDPSRSSARFYRLRRAA